MFLSLYQFRLYLATTMSVDSKLVKVLTPVTPLTFKKPMALQNFRKWIKLTLVTQRKMILSALQISQMTPMIPITQTKKLILKKENLKKQWIRSYGSLQNLELETR